MSGKPRRILLVAGEASGDRYGSLLVRSLRNRDSAMGFTGIGGSRMREAGVDGAELAAALTKGQLPLGFAFGEA